MIDAKKKLNRAKIANRLIIYRVQQKTRKNFDFSQFSNDKTQKVFLKKIVKIEIQFR